MRDASSCYSNFTQSPPKIFIYFHRSSRISRYLSSINPIMQHSRWVSVRTITFQLGCLTTRQTLSLLYVGSPYSTWKCLVIKMLEDIGKLYATLLHDWYMEVHPYAHISFLKPSSKDPYFCILFFQVSESLRYK